MDTHRHPWEPMGGQGIMAFGLKVRIRGSRKLARKLRLLVFAGDDIIERGVVRALLIVEAEARRRVPKKSGRLERTGRSAITERKPGLIRGSLGFNTKYAARLELEALRHRSKPGFVGKPTPYIMPALLSKKSDIVIEIARATREAILAARRL